MVNTHSEGNQSAVCSPDQVYHHHLSVRPSAISLTVLLSSKRNTRSSPRSVSGAAADAAWSASPQSLSSSSPSSSCNWTDGHRLCGKFPSITQQIKRPISPRSLGDPIRVSFNGVSGSSSSTSSRHGQSFVAPFPSGCSSHLLQQEHNQCARLCSTFPASQSARARFHQPAVDPSSSPSSSECMKKRLIR